MIFVRYGKYAPSGIEWLGEVPAHWDLQKAAWHFETEKGRDAQVLTKEYCGKHEGLYPVYSGQTANEGVMGRIDTFEFDVGDEGILFSTTVGAKAMHVSHLFGKFSLSQNCLIIGPRSEAFHLRFAYFAFQVLFRFERLLIPDHMQASFRMDDFYQYRVVRPPLKEQTQIAKFLDYETGKMDALIEKQQQLIRLLKEKRQAVISHAVTKGLNPDAPLRDSGIPWLGEVPAHWEVKRLGYIAAVGNGSTPNRSVPEYWSNRGDGVGWLNSTKINDGEIYAAEQFISQHAVRECHLPLCEPDSVLVAITGEGQTRGRVALLKISSTINQHLAYLLPDRRRMAARFLWRQFQARYSWLRFESAGGGSTRAALTCEFLRSVPVTLPPLGEQIAVLKKLDQEVLRLDEIVEKSLMSLCLLQERRTALISAAVTGKIDVRNWQPPAPQTQTEPA